MLPITIYDVIVNPLVMCNLLLVVMTQGHIFVIFSVVFSVVWTSVLLFLPA